MTQFDEKYDRYNYPTTSINTASGHPGNTTPEQDAMVFAIRAQLEGEGYTERLDTITLLRFLRARKFDIPLAKKMFVECEQWRKTFGVDELVKSFEYTEKSEVAKYYPQYYHKTDKDGRPIYIESLGKIDLTAMYKITTQERMLQNLVVEYEKLADPRFPACSRKTGKLLETCCTIMDLKGVGITSIKSVYNFVNSVSAISQNYYPERLGKLYIINAPWGFSGAFSLIKSFLDPVTVEKIHILGSGYKSTLLEQIPAENLPVEFGGSCSCEGGCGFSDAGPWKEPQYIAPAFKPAPTATTVEATATEAVAAPATLEPEVPKDPAPTPTTTAPPAAPLADPAAAPVVLNKIDEKLETTAEDSPAAPAPSAAPTA